MDKILSYTLREEDLAGTAGGLVNLVLKNCVRVTGHEISAAKFTEGGITCDGRQVRVTERMRPGQTLRVVLPEERDEEKLIPVPGPVRVLYEDEDLIAVDKAAGEVVHPGPGHYTDTIANHVTWYLRKRSKNNDPAPAALRVIGRLDKETSGVLLFAKSRAAAARLQRQRREGTLVRTYLAVCEGIFPEKSGTIDRPVEKVPGVLMKMRVVPDEDPAPSGLRAVTHYEVLGESGGCSLLALTIETGRTHQIRVHLASIGHPLIGDTLYGSGAPSREQVKSMPDAAEGGSGTRALLHACELRLIQPFTGQPLRITSPLPEDFAGAFRKDHCESLSAALKESSR